MVPEGPGRPEEITVGTKTGTVGKAGRRETGTRFVFRAANNTDLGLAPPGYVLLPPFGGS
jgi:hypothetical protein